MEGAAGASCGTMTTGSGLRLPTEPEFNRAAFGDPTGAEQAFPCPDRHGQRAFPVARDTQMLRVASSRRAAHNSIAPAAGALLESQRRKGVMSRNGI
jgi:hypothetical protein